MLALKAKVADLSLMQKNAATDKAAQKINEDIAKIGRYYQLFYSPFEPQCFDQNMSPPTFVYNSSERYTVVPGHSGGNQAAAQRRLGELADVFHCVPQKYYTYMAMSEGFKEKVSQLEHMSDDNILTVQWKFLAGLGDARSQCLHRLRTNADKIFGTELSPFMLSKKGAGKPTEETEPTRKLDLPGVRKLLRDKKGVVDPCSRFPSVFYPGVDFDIKDLFTNGILFEV